jgi:hypothetical protein
MVSNHDYFPNCESNLVMNPKIYGQ